MFTLETVLKEKDTFDFRNPVQSFLNRLQAPLRRLSSLLEWTHPLKKDKLADTEDGAISLKSSTATTVETIVEKPKAIPMHSQVDNTQQQLDHAPNISLNVHGGSQSSELLLAAICGLVIQLGVVAFSAFAVYHSTFKTRFEKDGSPVNRWAFPIMAAGTGLLMIGMVACSHIVGHSSQESEVVPRDGNQKMYTLWLQRRHQREWWVETDPGAFAPTQRQPEGGGDRGSEPSDNLNDNTHTAINTPNDAQLMFEVRRKLGELTGWNGPATDTAQAVTRSIDVVMNALVPLGPNFTWDLRIGTSVQQESAIADSSSQSPRVTRMSHRSQPITLRINNDGKRWKADEGDIETISAGGNSKAAINLKNQTMLSEAVIENIRRYQKILGS
ncbi:hypothetical protein EX30DRAFT_375886 [Ascodesmis nigricans]|uniref:Uncharacterized protein n=1 Tax=Ascodesmis nigricans TaxID=341454 RepID=A0A4V3SJL4_9PEZI|nr:hypothetical protein EX30DRAFT_375886 [Ascodesmis nigricans]